MSFSLPFADGLTLRKAIWKAIGLVALSLWSCNEVLLDPVPSNPEGAEELVRLAKEGPSLPYLVLGDWGRRGRGYQTEVARQMGIAAQTLASRFVITAGDNFYDDGVRSVNDSHWQESYERVYTHASLQTPWYASLGNHDYRGKVQAQMDYAHHSPRWTLPSPYYSVVQKIDTDTDVRFIFVDTQAIRKGFPGAPAQLRWIDATLAASTADWHIVVGHHPIYSGGQHGDGKVLIKDLLPLLEKHQVTAYFSGHDHDLQHLYDGRLHYFVSGAASKVRRTGQHRHTEFAITRPGFAVVSMTASEMTVQFIDHQGAFLYGTTIPHPVAAEEAVATLLGQ